VISIALIEDNRLVREGIAALLNQVGDLQVVAAGSGADLSLLRETKPQVVLLDLGLRSADSLGVAKKVVQRFPQSRIIVMDLLPVEEDVIEFLEAGVAGFIMKDATLDDLVATIRTAANAGFLPPPLTETLISRIARCAADGGRPPALESVRMTPREREVIQLIAEGLSNKEIAKRLRIAAHTAKSHVRNVMEKLMLHTRLQIAAYAHQDDIP
jgi:DNA-binding NarL/FixJ family response regulator